MMRTGDGQIISQCLNGDPAIFGVLVDKYKEGIYGIALSKLGNFHDAQDITQETFIKAYQKLHSLRQYESFPVWLCAIASNLCKDFVRSRSARPDREYFEEQSPKIIDRLSIDSHKADSMTESLRDALESLPEVYRQVLMLHYFSGMNRIDIAILLGVSLRTVGKRLKIAREILKEEMIAMIGTAIKEQKLPSGFTFRIVELVKRTKIQPVSQLKGLPWGLSIATGLIITILSINPAILHFVNVGTPIFAPLPSETKVLKSGEIPVDTIKISDIPMLSSMMGKGRGGELKPDMQNAFFMAPRGEGGTWTKKADMPTARISRAGVVNGKIYVIGGADDKSVLAIVEEYDPMVDKWTKKADMPTPRNACGISVANGKIYVIGGVDINFTFMSTVEEYDPIFDKWAKKSDMPTARSSLSASTVNGKIYAIGGGGNALASIAVEEYDPVIDKWTKKANMPTARGALSTSVVNDRIYAVGGQDLVNWQFVLATVEEYDPVADKWTKKTDMMSAKFCPAIAVLDGKIYALGGRDRILNPVLQSYLASVEEYDPVTDKWTSKTDMPTARYSLATGVVNGKIYAIGGGNLDGYLSTVEEYTPEYWQSVSPQDKLPSSWGQQKEK